MCIRDEIIGCVSKWPRSYLHRVAPRNPPLARKGPSAASAATRVQASRVRRRLLLAAKASRRSGCRKIRKMGTPAKLRASRTECGKERGGVEGVEKRAAQARHSPLLPS